MVFSFLVVGLKILPLPTTVDLSGPGIKPMSPDWQVDSLLLSHQGSAFAK